MEKYPRLPPLRNTLPTTCARSGHALSNEDKPRTTSRAIRCTTNTAARQKGLLMAFKLLEMAQQRWRRINRPQLVPLVRAGIEFVDGVQVEREPLAKDAA